MIAEIDEPITFWLDAHAGNSATAGRIYAPLLHELEIIGAHKIKDHVILIDDIRLFGQGIWVNISVDKVMAIIRAINPKYTFRFCDSRGYPQDILVAVVEDD